jgi:hypothetical protein
MGIVPSSEPDLVQFSFRQSRIVYFTNFYPDMEISQSRFSCSNKVAGFDAFQNSVAEIVEIHILATWERIKECKFLAAGKIL